MEIRLNINEDKLKEMACKEIVNNITSANINGLKTEANYGIRKGVEEGVKQYIYSKKEYIIEKVIERASIEIVKKALPKLMDKVNFK